MKLNSLTPNLMVENVNIAADFYISKLGFTYIMGVKMGTEEGADVFSPDVPLQFAMVKRDNISIMLQEQKNLSSEIEDFEEREIGGTFTLFCEVEDVEGLYNEWKDSGAIIKDLNVTFYGMKEFYVRDTSGYILGFAEPEKK